MITEIKYAIGGGTIVASVGVLAFFNYRKAKVSEIAKNLSVDIPEKVLEEAVNRAAEEEARSAIFRINNKIIRSYEDDIRKEVQKEVERQKASLKSDVKEELERKVKRIDIDDIRKEVIDEAKDKVARKFEHDLDDILDKHNDELDKITRIYSSIADKLEGN